MQHHRPTVRVSEIATAINQAGHNLARMQRYVDPLITALGEWSVRVNRNLSGAGLEQPVPADMPAWEFREIAHGSF